MNFNRSTVPDDKLEQIMSPTALTLSFNKFYHLDSIQWYDEYGKQVINIPTVCYNFEGVDYSQVSEENYGMISPYHFPLDEKQYSIIHVMEVLANCDFSSYQKLQKPIKVTVFDYLDHGLPQIFYDKVFKPLLQSIFNHTLYVRTSSSKSIIKAISLNKVGKITSVHLYNGEILNLEDLKDMYQSPETYEDLFRASIDDNAKEDLIQSYKNRLSLNSLKDYSQEAEILANKHIKEISKALSTEKIELLDVVGDNDQWNEFEETAYPGWINWLLGLSFFTFIFFVIFSVIAHNKKNVYIHRQNRINYVQKKYPFASQKNIMPSVLNNNVPRRIERLLKRNENELMYEEQQEAHKEVQGSSNLKRVSAENETIFEDDKSNKDKDFSYLLEHEKVKREEDSIKNDLKLLSQATHVGNIELAEEKIKALNHAILSPTVDVELAKAVATAENEYKCMYSEGISDTFKISYVDYTPPSRFVQKDNWNYAVAKFPTKGTVVFPYRRKKISRRGYIENTFQVYLADKLSKFKLNVFGDCAILPAENYRPYEPDIAIVDVECTSIRIDIEIDEPYSAITNKPIHYIGCGDDFRDMNLNNIGWIVVRFTEYQVISDMQGCVFFIAQLIHSLNPSKSFSQSLLTQNLPQAQKRWTEIEAKVMASEKVREKYLNHEFNFTDGEQIEITDIKQTKKEKSCAKLVKPLIIKSSYLTEKNNVSKSVMFERDNHIQFLSLEHIYLYNGLEQFIPVSSIISCFFKPFDSNYWSEYKAKQRNVSQGQILEEWDAKGACSRDVGTFMHQQIENYYKGLPYQKEFSFNYNGKYIRLNEQINLEKEYGQFVEFLKNHKFKPFRTEWVIYDEELKIAGTIDMIHERGGVFDIYDWKRSHRIVNFWGEPITINDFGDKGLRELNHIEDTPYWHYCIQQNLYRYILERNYNIIIGKMYLVVFCDDTIEYRKLEVPRMDEVIVSIVKACMNGTVKNLLMALQGENLS